MTFQHFRCPSFPVVKQAIECSAIETIHGTREQFGCARRRSGTGIEQGNFNFSARERGIDSRKVTDYNSEKCKSHSCFRNREQASNCACGRDVAIAQGKKCFPAVIQQQTKINRHAVG